jgi:3-hydroxyisobutyryl-CoA hydrolase
MAFITRLLRQRQSIQMVRTLSTSSETDEVILTETNNAKVITLNRPKALNALNLAMIRAMHPQLKLWNDKDKTSLILVKGNGGKAFCAGGDVVAVTKSYKEKTSLHKDFFREEYQLNYLIGTLEVPYISLLDGITMGGGCGLSINGKFRVATERTLLAMPETALGLFPDVGGTHFLNRLNDNLGMFLALTGYRLKGADVYHSGLATHYISSTKLPELEEELLQLPLMLNNGKEKVAEILSKYQDNKSSLPQFSLSEQLPTIRKCFAADTVEGIFDSLRQTHSDFTSKQLNDLSKMSPTSLKVTFQQIKNGRQLKFADVFPVEYRLTQRFCQDYDFHEGCRAILVDKDRNPKWKPSKLEEVTKEKVDSYFAPLPSNEELTL